MSQNGNGRNGYYTAQEFIEAIPGTGGIISTIAKRVGCAWHTAKKYIDKHPTVRQAYDDEREANLDVAESVLITNIKMAARKQQIEVQGGGYDQVDSADAKWYLSRKGKHRGFAERREHTGAEGGAVTFRVVYDE